MKNNKSLGQHWLKDRQILDEIAELALGDAPEDTSAVENRTCVEIGPGLGTLTSSLLRLFPRVVAVEFDENLAKNLPKSFPGKNLEVVNRDFLKFDLDSIPAPYVIAGNIPYYITSPIIMKILETDNQPDRAVLLIQKEVAERIAAGAGSHTVLSLSVQNLANVKLGPIVKKELFTPAPKVDSEVIILEPKSPVVSEEVIRFIKKGFSAPRKKLAKNLNFIDKDLLSEAFSELNISENARPADLALDKWQKLYEKHSK